jgi:hypothetical protein
MDHNINEFVQSLIDHNYNFLLLGSNSRHDKFILTECDKIQKSIKTLKSNKDFAKNYTNISKSCEFIKMTYNNTKNQYDKLYNTNKFRSKYIKKAHDYYIFNNSASNTINTILLILLLIKSILILISNITYDDSKIKYYENTVPPNTIITNFENTTYNFNIDNINLVVNKVYDYTCNYKVLYHNYVLITLDDVPTAFSCDFVFCCQNNQYIEGNDITVYSYLDHNNNIVCIRNYNNIPKKIDNIENSYYKYVIAIYTLIIVIFVIFIVNISYCCSNGRFLFNIYTIYKQSILGGIIHNYNRPILTNAVSVQPTRSNVVHVKPICNNGESK